MNARRDRPAPDLAPDLLYSSRVEPRIGGSGPTGSIYHRIPLTVSFCGTERTAAMSQIAPTLTHDWIWQAIDRLASSKGLSASALARLANLDPTTFNRSKRFTPEGRPRWPSTESISKILAATGTSLDEFAALNCVEVPSAAAHAAAPAADDVPVVGEVREAAVTGLNDAQMARKVVAAQDRRRGGRAPIDARFALAVADASLEPVYSRGNTLIASASVPAEAGDRVIVKPAGRSPIPRLLLKSGPQRLELAGFDPKQRRLRIDRRKIEWIARIIWVRQ